MLNPYYKSKNWLNYLFDRIIDSVNMILMDAYSIPLLSRNVAHRVARYIGDLSWLLRDFPRLAAYKLVGNSWTIVFVGRVEGLREIQYLFFPDEEVEPYEIGRIALWQLQAKTEQWLAEVDLVICELSRIHFWRPRGPITFVVPTWIQQIVDIKEAPSALIIGDKRAHLRHQINRLHRDGFTSRFSQSPEDFNNFYYHMYLPFIKSRHDDLALIAPYEDQIQFWFNRGGLVLVTQNETVLAGCLCYLANDICFAIEEGVLEANPQLFRKGINTLLLWYVTTWGHSQGAKVFDMGGSHAWHSHGSFTFKRRWGAKVVRRKRIYATWTFLSQNPSSKLQVHINKLGFISEVNDKFYGVLLDTQPDVKVESKIETAQEYGLDGWMLVVPNTKELSEL